MADINIEKKKNNKPVWPWILGALLLAGIIWAVAEMGDNESEMDTVAVVEEPYEEQPVVTDPQANVIEEEASKDFVAYVEDTEIKDQMGLNHEVTGTALVKLSESLRNLAGDDAAYTQQLNDLEQTAREIQSDPQSLQHADKVNNAFSKSADVIKQIQENRFPETAQSDVEDLQEQARNLEDGEQLLNQKEEVKSFFEKASSAVESMKEETTATL